MKLSHDQVAQRISKYMTECMLPNAQNPANKFKIAFVLPIVPQMVAYYWRTGLDLGIIDDQGLDTDKLAACMESGFKHVDQLPIQSFKFNMDDAKIFLRCLNS